MKRFLMTAALFGATAAIAAAAPETRHFDLNWTITAKDVPEGAKEMTLWIAVPQEKAEQSVSDLRIDTTYPWEFVTDPDFGNKVVKVTVKDPKSALAVNLSANVVRRSIDEPVTAELSDTEKALYLRKEALVSLSPRVKGIAKTIGLNDRARYDYVLNHMDYDKTAPGWGYGDTERACDVGKGNCTDFHSLFMSLSRAEGVPTVFEMGYPTKPDGETNAVGGYHCWAWFHENGAWTPVDISEADKHPEKADYFYGHLDADRILFSRGRDVKLPGMQGGPLNYLPAGAYAEVDGKPFDGVTRSLSYTVDGKGAKAEN